MKDNSFEWIKMIALLVGALVPLVKAINELLRGITISKLSQLSKLMLFVLFTLLLPDYVIVLFSMDWVSSYLATFPQYLVSPQCILQEYQIAMEKFIVQLVSITSAVAAIYPLVWGIYVYPVFREHIYRNNNC
jgi:hypothetical protein